MNTISDPQSQITHRMRCAAGHLNAVIEMVESAQPCEQILYQLNAVQCALRQVGIQIIECQARSSQDVIMNSTSVTQRVDELRHLQSLYAIFLKQYRNKNEANHEQDSN